MRRFKGECPVCHKVHPLLIAVLDPEDRDVIENGGIEPVKGYFMLDMHEFNGKPCVGAVSASPARFFEIHEGMVGVCCSCQSVHPVDKRDRPLCDESDFPGDESEKEGWVMREHKFPGMNIRCDGSGTMPQAVFEAE